MHERTRPASANVKVQQRRNAREDATLLLSRETKERLRRLLECLVWPPRRLQYQTLRPFPTAAATRAVARVL